MKRRFIASLLTTIALFGAVPNTVTLDVNGAKLQDVITLLASQTHQNIIVDETVEHKNVTLHLVNVSPAVALEGLEHAYNLAQIDKGSYLLIVPNNSTTTNGLSQSVELPTPNGQAQMFADHLPTTIPGLDATVVDANTIMLIGTPEKLSEAAALVKQAGADFAYQSFDVTYSSPSDMIDQLKKLGLVTQTTRIVADNQSGTITIAGSSAQRAAVGQAISSIDHAPTRMEFEIQVLSDTPYNDATHRGIVWGLPTSNNNGSGSTQVTVNGGTTVTQFINKTLPIAAQIDQAASTGSARVLATPVIAENSSGTAKFISGETYPIETTTTGLLNGNSVQWYQIGIQLTIQAIKGKDGAITGTINASWSDIASFDPNTKLPIIANSQTSNPITIYKGESLVLAGFYQDTDTDTLSKVPGIGDIPLIGEFFRDRQTSHQRTELTFIITPKENEQRYVREKGGSQ